MGMTTFSGKSIDLLNPSEDMFDIGDIAHALANSSRFNGHTYHPYSIAQHSLLVASILEDTEYEYEGLMHDTPEAFTGDIIRPLKILLPDFKNYENNISRIIANKFHFTYPMPEEVAWADAEALNFEKKFLFTKNNLCWTAKLSKQLFLEKYEWLSKKLSIYPPVQ